MIPDYSFFLLFKNQFREQVRSRFSELFDFTQGGMQNFPSFDHKKWKDHNTSLIAPPDITQESADRYVITNNSCGRITVIYRPETHFNDCFSLELWPCTSGLQFIFFSSMHFRTTLVDLLSENGGIYGSILFESSAHIEFWPPVERRQNDNEPPRTSDQLFLPSFLRSN